MYKQRGVTLVALAITIIVMLILASTAVYVGSGVIENSRRTTFVTEMQMVQEKVKIYHEKGEESYRSLGQVLSSSPVTTEEKTKIQTSTGLTLDDQFRYFNTDNYSQIELSGIKRETLVNFVTKQVIGIGGIKDNGNMCYTLEQLKENQYEPTYSENQNTVKPTYAIAITTTEDGWKYTATNVQYGGYVKTGSLQYKEKGTTTWNEATNLTFSITKPGLYETRIVDKAGNESETKLVPAYVKDGLLLYLDGTYNTNQGHKADATIWEDLSGNNDSGELKNFNSDLKNMWVNEGLELDGVDDGVYMADQLINLYKNDTTIELVTNFTNDNSRDVIMGNFNNPNSINLERGGGAGNGTYPLQGRVYYNSGELDYRTPENIYKMNTNISISYLFNKKANSLMFYANGTKKSSVSNSILNKNYDFKNVWIGKDERNGGTAMKGKIYTVRIYNRLLTSEENLQNYQIDKQRYSIEE